MKSNSVIASCILAVGLLALGLSVRSGMLSFIDSRRTVDVRGLAEREVQADVVTWPIMFKLYGNDLPLVYSQVSTTNEKVITFLTENGISRSEISISAPQMEDRQSNPYINDRIPYRYYITSVVTVSSSQVDRVRELVNRQGELLAEGIPVVAQDYSNRVSYTFTGLNEIKPAMIAEATANAREAAQKFANDSQSKLGKIVHAAQGQFSIDDRDDYTPYIKRVRVVTTLTYSLND